MRAFAFLRRLVGLRPKTSPARVPSGEEQAFLDALDDVREKLEEFTRKMQARAKRQREAVTDVACTGVTSVTHDYVTPSQPWPRSVIKAPPWLVERMAELKARTPPTKEEVQTQMESSAKLRRMLDRGMTQEEAKQFALDHSNDVLAHLNAPWREKVGENRYAGTCGCVFDAEGKRLEWCGDHY